MPFARVDDYRVPVYRLSREVRFAVDLTPDPRPPRGRNGFAGKPPVAGLGQVYHALAVTVEGEPDATSGYLVNIKAIDDAVRDRAVPLVADAVRRATHRADGGGGLVGRVFAALADAFGPHRLVAVELALSPLTSLRHSGTMTYLKHAFEFAASHRLHAPSLSDEANRRLYGKCNNPHGHGHNYRLEVVLRGTPGDDGRLVAVEELERAVDEAVIGPLDHKHLNSEVPEFRDGLNPSVEHIAQVAYRRLGRALAGALPAGVALDAVTVWETPKTWCEYREG